MMRSVTKYTLVLFVGVEIKPYLIQFCVSCLVFGRVKVIQTRTNYYPQYSALEKSWVLCVILTDLCGMQKQNFGLDLQFLN